jgi:predicted AAA+ superfamily ATPase
MPVVVLTGLRQSGKSTFLRNEPGLKDRAYKSLDDLEQLKAARADPKGFVREQEALTIDEAQRCPDLLLAIKQEVDRDRQPGRFLLSGSADFSLLHSVGETLAGRAIHRVLHPLSVREVAGAADTPPLLHRLLEGDPPTPGPASGTLTDDVLAGGLPPVRLGLAPRPDLWFEGYEQTYLERDLRELSRLGDIVPFRTLMRLAALRTASVLSISELARDAKLSAETAGRYLGLLEASFVVRRLPPFLGNRAARLIKSPKLLVTDSGLAAHLAGAAARRLPREDPLWGALLETWVAQNLASIVESEGCGTGLSYWHVQGRHEVDFVVEAGRDCLAIEVKSAARWDSRDLSGLRTFLERTPRCRAAVLAHGGTETVSLGERLWVMPVATLLS